MIKSIGKINSVLTTDTIIKILQNRVKTPVGDISGKQVKILIVQSRRVSNNLVKHWKKPNYNLMFFKVLFIIKEFSKI